MLPSTSSAALLAAALLAACNPGPDDFGGTTVVADSTAAIPTAAAATAAPFTADSFADSVALAHGFDHWSDVERLDFAFRVLQGGEEAALREWSWYPRADSVVLSGADGMSYTRSGAFTDEEKAVDADFVNDTYWIAMPFYLVWNEGDYAATVVRDTIAPLAGAPARMLTVQYTGDGGYTPGDAYDLFVDDDYRITEWTYRKGGAPEPTMTLTWGDYAELDGLILPANHEAAEGFAITHPTLEVAMR